MHMEDAVKAAVRRVKIRVGHKLTKDALDLSVLCCLIIIKNNKQTAVYPPVLSSDPFTGRVFDQCFFFFLYHSANRLSGSLSQTYYQPFSAVFVYVSYYLSQTSAVSPALTCLRVTPPAVSAVQITGRSVLFVKTLFVLPS